jgi:hypothetical protein
MKPPGFGAELLSIYRARRKAEAEEQAWRRIVERKCRSLDELTRAERDLVLRRTHGPAKPHVWWRLGEGTNEEGPRIPDGEVSV